MNLGVLLGVMMRDKNSPSSGFESGSLLLLVYRFNSVAHWFPLVILSGHSFLLFIMPFLAGRDANISIYDSI